MKKILLIGGIVVIGLAIVFLMGDKKDATYKADGVETPDEDPIDVTLDFVDQWLANLATTSSLSVIDFVSTQDSLSPELIEKLSGATDSAIDPITCQRSTPDRVGGKEVFVTDSAAQVMVLARGGPKTPEQAIVTLGVVDGAWQLTDLACATAESGGPVGEFSFEQDGRLVKESLPAQYDTAQWHIIFTKIDGSIGVVPLLLDGVSQCVQADSAGVCDTAQFEEGQDVLVKANMLEAGAEVRAIEFK